MSRPTDRQLSEWADRLEEAARLIRPGDRDPGRLGALLDRDRFDLTPDGFGAGGDSSRSSGPADPTLAAVLHLTGDDVSTAEQKARRRANADYIGRCAKGARAAAERAAQAAQVIAGLIREGERIEDKAKTRQSTVAACAEPACEEPSALGRQGRCESCAKWRQRYRNENPNNSVPPVPVDLIEARKIRKLRQREDGSMVG